MPTILHANNARWDPANRVFDASESVLMVPARFLFLVSIVIIGKSTVRWRPQAMGHSLNAAGGIVVRGRARGAVLVEHVRQVCGSPA